MWPLDTRGRRGCSIVLSLSLLMTSSSETFAFFICPSSTCPRAVHSIMLSKSDNNGENQTLDAYESKRAKMRQKVKDFAKTIMIKPIKQAASGKVIADILTDATSVAVDLAVDEVSEARKALKEISSGKSSSSLRSSAAFSHLLEAEAAFEGDTSEALDSIALAKTTAADAFAITESAIQDTEEALRQSKRALELCKRDVARAIAIAEKSAMQANISSQKATALAASAAFQAGEDTVQRDVQSELEEDVSVESMDKNLEMVEVATSDDILDTDSLRYEDIDYHLSEMAPPFLGEDQCLVPGEAVVRVEKAPENSRRIFAGIDIMASVDDVWKVLTDYDHLQNVVPNLVVNDVLEQFQPDKSLPLTYEINPKIKSEEQCRALSTRMKGAKMRQIGGAKVVGINFSARTTLEVREWPNGIPDFFHFDDDIYEGESRNIRARKERKQKLERYHFPRPFAISKLPTKDISMQSVEDDDGEFRLYQGVWRMQPLPGCAPEGGSAMRLTYAVEISPRPYLPVALVEGRISQDLCNNLAAIRDYVT